MRHLPYDENEAKRLLPLLRAIGDEILERQAAILVLEESPPSEDDVHARAGWSAELAVHRRELRRAHQELDRLGCSLVGRVPLTFRIPGRGDVGAKSFLWQGGELLVY